MSSVPPVDHQPPFDRLGHALAWTLACFTFPLIWVGGLVTTYGAGMAVPDWPNTFGYNLFLYPLESWLHVWDVFLEHSHRLIGAATGLLTVALVAVLWSRDDRRWTGWLGVTALVAVSAQGVLGGFRVTQNAVFLAKVHGCTAPVFFALTAAMVGFTSPAWRNPTFVAPLSRVFPPLTLAVTAAVYLQIVLGAQLRHPDPELSPVWFYVWVWLHVLVAAVLTVAVIALAHRAKRLAHRSPEPIAAELVSPAVLFLVRRVRWLFWLLVLQLVLGIAAWVTHYNWPAWFGLWFNPIDYTVKSGGRLQGFLTTAHVAVGSLTLVTALSSALWSLRLRRTPQEAAP